MWGCGSRASRQRRGGGERAVRAREEGAAEGRMASVGWRSAAWRRERELSKGRVERRVASWSVVREICEAGAEQAHVRAQMLPCVEEGSTHVACGCARARAFRFNTSITQAFRFNTSIAQVTSIMQVALFDRL